MLISVKLAMDSKKQLSSTGLNGDDSPEETQMYQRKEWQRDEDGEFEETKALTNVQVLDQNKAQLAAQDHMLDRIGDVVQNIRHENTNFRDEVQLQNEMLDEVNEDMEVNLNEMVKLDSKLKTMLTKASTCRLWMCVIIEIVIMVLIFMFLS